MHFLGNLNARVEYSAIFGTQLVETILIDRGVLSTHLDGFIVKHYHVYTKSCCRAFAIYAEHFVNLAITLENIENAKRKARDLLQIKCGLAYRTAVLQCDSKDSTMRQLVREHNAVIFGSRTPMQQLVLRLNQLALVRKSHDDKIAQYRKEYRATYVKLDASLDAALRAFVCPDICVDHSEKILHSLNLVYGLLATYINKLMV
jgi:hypothetical protein